MKIFHFETLNSTQTKAKEIVDGNSPHTSFIVLAETQTKGYGRRGQEWFSPKDNLYITYALHRQQVRAEAALQIATNLCIFLEKKCNTQLSLKWPNDLYYDYKKLGGILVEKYQNFMLVGIGINFSSPPNELSSQATSLKEISNTLLTPQDFISQFNIINALNSQWYEHYINRMYLKNTIISFSDSKNTLSGLLKGITRDGKLCIDVAGKEQRFHSGEIQKLRKL